MGFETSRQAGLDILDDERARVVRHALINILSTELAEFTFAQILDGLPTEQVFLESGSLIFGHPVSEMEHTKLCDGFLEKARQFRSGFDPATLAFDKHLSKKAQPSSKEFNLRLIELVVVACHQIGAFLFELDDSAHKEVHSSWLAKVTEERECGKSLHSYLPPRAAFFHRYYQDDDQYPRGLADVVGYWAEGRIFGGVVVFDRGKSEQEDVWIHGILAAGPRTLYPPTTEQLEKLEGFLLADQSNGCLECPLPIHGTRSNRPRWDPIDSMRFHIFRDRYERKIPLVRPPRRITHTFANWPELEDNWVTLELTMRKEAGERIDEKMLDEAFDGLQLDTPSSPMWQR